jgi:diaminopimelate decarboxylase
VAEEGLHLDVCTGGELAVAQRAGFPAERIGFHGNNKTVAEIREALSYGVGRIVVDSFQEIDRIAAVAADLGVVAPVMVRVTVGVEAHTHEFIATGHEDQKFGFSLAGGQAEEAARRILARRDVFDLRGLHSHIGSQIFDTSGFEAAAHRLVGLHARIADEHGHHCPEIDLGGGYGIAYTSQHTPLPAAILAEEMAGIVERELKAVGDGDTRHLPRVSVEPGRAIVGPSTFTLYEVGTVKEVEIGGGHLRTYVSVDGGMSDNARPALYEADYSCTLASRYSDAGPRLSRVVGRHCESGDIVVLDEYLPADLAPGDLIAVPGTGAYCRSLSSQYNHTPRPPVVAVRGGRSRVLVRRETIEDLLALDVADA